MTTALIAFACGLLVGALIARGFGWLCLIASFTIATQADAAEYWKVRAHNLTSRSASVSIGYYSSPPSGGWWEATVIMVSAGGTVLGNNMPTNSSSYWWANITPSPSTPTIPSCNLGGGHDVANQIIDLYFNDTNSWSSISPTYYYMSGCLTNYSQQRAVFIAEASDGWSEVSPTLAPYGTGGLGYYCFNHTNTTPFTYHITPIYLDPEGATNNIPFPTPDYPAYTNTWPGTGGTGGGSYAGQTPNNPVGSGAGAGSTNPVTGGQYANGISNIVNAMWQNNQALLTSLGTNSSGAGGNTTNQAYLGMLQAISNNTAWLTNVAFSNSMLYSNWADMQRWIATNGGAAMSNNASGEGYYVSNAYVGGVMSRAGGVLGLTNAWMPTTDNERSVWILGPCKTNLDGPLGYIDLNPLHNEAVAGMFSWVRFAIRWWIQITAFVYMVRRMNEMYLELIHTPGAGPGTSDALAGLLVWFQSNAAWAAILLAVAVAALAGLDTYIADTGGWLNNPFTAAGVAEAGTAGRYLLAGLEMVEAMLPISMMFFTVVVLFIFDLTTAGQVMWFGRLVKAVCN